MMTAGKILILLGIGIGMFGAAIVFRTAMLSAPWGGFDWVGLLITGLLLLLSLCVWVGIILR